MSDNYLRKCSECGLEAFTVEDLEKFTKAKKYKYGRRNICKSCFAASLRKGGKYGASHSKASKRWDEKNKERRAARRRQRVTMKTENGFARPYLENDPRTGVCSECGKKVETIIHHDEYDVSNPIKNTRELCRPCHARFHRLKEQDGLERLK